MSHGGNIYEIRSWMYAHKNSAGAVTDEFLNGAEMFMYQARKTPLMQLDLFEKVEGYSFCISVFNFSRG